MCHGDMETQNPFVSVYRPVVADELKDEVVTNGA